MKDPVTIDIFPIASEAAAFAKESREVEQNLVRRVFKNVCNAIIHAAADGSNALQASRFELPPETVATAAREFVEYNLRGFSYSDIVVSVDHTKEGRFIVVSCTW